MINYTPRLDMALRRAAWAHGKQDQYRKGTDIPFIIHPVGAMSIASNATDDEDTLIACLLHDVLEDVASDIYSEADMRAEFGDHVTVIVKDVTKDEHEKDWHKMSNDYLVHLRDKACDEAVVVATADKIHNLMSTLIDYESVGNDIWNRFSTKSGTNQLWWYESNLAVVKDRQTPPLLLGVLSDQVERLRLAVSSELS